MAQIWQEHTQAGLKEESANYLTCPTTLRHYRLLLVLIYCESVTYRSYRASAADYPNFNMSRRNLKDRLDCGKISSEGPAATATCRNAKLSVSLQMIKGKLSRCSGTIMFRTAGDLFTTICTSELAGIILIVVDLETFSSESGSVMRSMDSARRTFSVVRDLLFCVTSDCKWMWLFCIVI
jgi:hypothetical protein